MKKFIFLVILFFSINNSFAYDFQESYNFSGLGNMRPQAPFNFDDITINQESDIYIYYNSNSCDYDGAYYIEILGIGSIDCVQNNDYGLNFGTFTLSPGTYELEINNQSNEYYYLFGDVIIGGNYTSTSSSSGGGSTGSGSGGITGSGNTTIFDGDFYDIEYKKVGFFADYDEFIEFAEETTIMYMIGLLLVTLGLFGRAIHNSID